MRRRLLLVAAVSAWLVPLSASADWTVAHRLALPASGQPVDLAGFATPGDETLRFVLSGTVSFSHDGSQIDAMSRRVSGRHDVAAGPFVVLPAGATVIESDPVAHRYTVEAPVASSMPVAFNLVGLATQNLLTATEASRMLSGAIVLEHLAPPAPPPAPVERAAASVTRTASAVPGSAIAGGSFGALLLMALGIVFVRRRREPVGQLLRRAARAREGIAREVLELGPAFDPVSASADRLREAASQHAAHHRAIDKALERTAWTNASKRRLELTAKRAEAFARLAELVDRLEDTATHLAARSADSDRARGVDALLDRLDLDLGAALDAEEELGL